MVCVCVGLWKKIPGKDLRKIKSLEKCRKTKKNAKKMLTSFECVYISGLVVLILWSVRNDRAHLDTRALVSHGRVFWVYYYFGFNRIFGLFVLFVSWLCSLRTDPKKQTSLVSFITFVSFAFFDSTPPPHTHTHPQMFNARATILYTPNQ